MENGNRELGELSAKIDSLTRAFHDFRDEVRRGLDVGQQWRDRHDGQGSGTTHSKVWQELDGVRESLSTLKANASFFGAVGGAISAALSVLGVKIFGGHQ